MRLKYVLPYIIAFLFIAFSFVLLFRYYDCSLIYQVSLYELAVSILLALITLSVSGFQYHSLLSLPDGTRISISDIVMLPASMRLWGYILPAKGGLVYASAYLKCKYGIRLLTSFSISGYIYLSSLFIMGCIGLFVALTSGRYVSFISFFSCLFILAPAMVGVMSKIAPCFPLPKNKTARIFLDSFVQLLNDLNASWTNVKTTLFLLATNVVHTLLTFILYYWASLVFDLSLSAMSILMLALVLKISVILRFTPGNLGVEQLVSGGTIALLGGTAGDGILLSVFVSFTTLLIAGTLGTLNTISAMRYFHTKNFHALLTLFSRNPEN